MSAHDAMWLTAELPARKLLRNRAEQLRVRAMNLRNTADVLDGAAADLSLAVDAIEALIALPPASGCPPPESSQG